MIAAPAITVGARVVRSSAYMDSLPLTHGRKRARWPGTVTECFVFAGSPMCVVRWDREHEGAKAAIPWFTHLAENLEMAT